MFFPMTLESLVMRTIQRAEDQIEGVEIQFTLVPDVSIVMAQINEDGLHFDEETEAELVKKFENVEIIMRVRNAESGYALTNLGALVEDNKPEKLILSLLNASIYALTENEFIDQDYSHIVQKAVNDGYIPVFNDDDDDEEIDEDLLNLIMYEGEDDVEGEFDGGEDEC